MQGDSSSSSSLVSAFGASASYNASPRARSSSSLDVSLTSHIRISLVDAPKSESILESLIHTFSQFGEVQHADVSRMQFDRSFAISYFDIRAAALARKTVASGGCPGMVLTSTGTSSPSLGSLAEHIPYWCTVSARSVEVIGFPTGEMVEECNSFLLTVFTRFGEVESIFLKGKDVFEVLFFDYRSPSSVQAVLQGPSKEWSEKVVVCSEQLVTLLLAGSQVDDTAPSVPLRSANPSRTLSTTPPEFLINLRDIEKGLERRTTVMIRNIPRQFSQAFLIETINMKMSSGIPGGQATPFFDFVYLPLDLGTSLNVGYAFVNLIEPELVIQLFNRFNNKRWPGSEDCKGTAKVTFARIQGLHQLVVHFSRSSIMNQPDSIRPYFLPI